MNLITNVTSDPLQNMSLVLPNGNTAELTIYFSLTQTGWFILNLTYLTFVLQGYRIVNSPNMLGQWQNQIPFGLACFTANNREPTQQGDFSSGQSLLYTLSQTEVAEWQAVLESG